MSFVPLGEVVRRHAMRDPERLAIRSGLGRNLTYRELDERSSKMATALLARGLAKGDRIAAWLGNRSEYVEIYLAAAKARLALVPINERSTAAEAGPQLDETEPRVIFVDERSSAEFAKLDPGSRHVLAVGCGAGTDTETGYESLLSESDAGGVAECEPSDLLVIGYTSGTTGRPKGAMLTHGAFKSAVVSCASVTGLPLQSVGVHGKSISLVGAVAGSVFGHLYMGGALVLLEKWDTEAIFSVVEEVGASFVNIATPKIAEIIDFVEAKPECLRSVRTVMRSGMSASSDLVERLVAVVGPRYVTGWGMTENAGAFVTATSFLDHERPDAATVMASAGRPVMETVVRVVDCDELSFPDGRAGELVVSSPNLMSGYWKHPEESAMALAGGWYRTGDVGSLDAEGLVHIVDRRTDLIVSGGLNVYPRELEQVIGSMPGVAGCVVVGVSHPKWGRSPVAIVSLAPGVVIAEEQVVDQVRRTLASYKKPTAVLFRDDIPENLSGKAVRASLSEWAAMRLREIVPAVAAECEMYD